MTTPPTATPPKRRWWLLVSILVAQVLLFNAGWLWEKFDFDPTHLITVMTVGGLGSMLCFLLLGAWFLFLGGFRGKTKLAVIGLLVAAVGGFAACVERVEFTGSVSPVFVMKWDKKPAPTTAIAPGVGIDLTAGPRDFPRYRGATFDGTVTGVRLADDWKARPPKELWRHACGGGYAGFAVAGNVAITIEQEGTSEAVVAFATGNGAELWLHTYEAIFKQSAPMGGDGPRSTPTIHAGLVYALGATGVLNCLDGRTGVPKWSVNILSDNGAKNTEWGATGSPLVAGDLVIVNPGIDPANNQNKAVAAYDRLTGAKRWAAGGHQASYCSPQSATFAGTPQVLIFDAGGLAGYDLADGRELWRFPFPAIYDQNITQPLLFDGDRVYITSQPDAGGAMLHVTRDGSTWSAKPVWANKQLFANFANPVRTEQHIFGLSNGRPTCLDAATGKRQWKESNYGSGQMLLVGEHLLVCSEKGELVLLAADPAAFRELGKFRTFDLTKNWNTPALVGNRLFVRNHTEMACFELPTK